MGSRFGADPEGEQAAAAELTRAPPTGNPWLAIDVSTAPAQRARELRHAWERFIGNGVPGAVRRPIADSWRRSHAAGVDPSGDSRAPVVADSDEASALWEVHPLAAAAPLIRECLAATADESRHLIVVSDADGMLLWIDGNATVRFSAADSLNFAEGALWSEGGAGTNAIGTALAADHAVQVFAAEHFNEIVQRWTCAAASVHDPDSGRLLGIIDLTGEMSSVHPHSLALAGATAKAVESDLLCRQQERDRRLRARYEDRMSGGGLRALVSASGRVLAGPTENGVSWVGEPRVDLPPDGGELVLPSGTRAFAESLGHDEAFLVRPLDRARGAESPRLLRLSFLGRDRAWAEIDARRIELRRRQSEILALLCANPGGLTTEALCADLHGDEGTTGSVRVEVSRLRKLLGPCIDTERYRLTWRVDSDVAQVQGLLRQGDVCEAAERYVGPLLPGSDAPGVRRERDALDGWVRQAVLTSDDQGALWAWVQSASGSDDLPAWKRLLTGLEFRDARRSLAASRLAQLRSDYSSA